MKNKTEILDYIKLKIEKFNPDQAMSINEDTNLFGDGILDSLDGMSLIFEIEKDLGYKLDLDEEMDDINVSVLTQLIFDKQEKRL